MYIHVRVTQLAALHAGHASAAAAAAAPGTLMLCRGCAYIGIYTYTYIICERSIISICCTILYRGPISVQPLLHAYTYIYILARAREGDL